LTMLVNNALPYATDRSMSMSELSELPAFDYDQRLPGLGLQLPARMSVLPLGAGKLALISPTPIDHGIAAALARLGEVQFLIAPNLLHHLYLAAAAKRYPGAQVLAPPGLRQKRPDLSIHGTLDQPAPEAVADAVEVLRMQGAPGIDEFVFFHRATRTLVVTDLVFNVLPPQGLAAHIFLFLGGCHGRLAQSRVWRFAIKDRAAAADSVHQILSLPFDTLVMAHGEIVHTDARTRLAAALGWLLPTRPTLPATR
jgi:hypothetical protein